jgi:hypothetical protein
MAAWLFEYEQHAAVSGKMGASHQAALALLRRGRDLDLEGMRADAQGQASVVFSGAGGAAQRSQE